MPSRSDLLTEAQARAIAEQVLSMSSAEHTSVRVANTWMGNTRSAVNRITTAECLSFPEFYPVEPVQCGPR